MESDKSMALRRRVNASLRCSACPVLRQRRNEKPSASPLAGHGRHRRPATTAPPRRAPPPVRLARRDSIRWTRSRRVPVRESGFQQLRAARTPFDSCRVMCIRPYCTTDLSSLLSARELRHHGAQRCATRSSGFPSKIRVGLHTGSPSHSDTHPTASTRHWPIVC